MIMSRITGRASPDNVSRISFTDEEYPYDEEEDRYFSPGPDRRVGTDDDLWVGKRLTRR